MVGNHALKAWRRDKKVELTCSLFHVKWSAVEIKQPVNGKRKPKLVHLCTLVPLVQTIVLRLSGNRQESCEWGYGGGVTLAVIACDFQ